MNISLLINLLLAHVFISTSVHKILNINSFEKTINDFIVVKARFFLKLLSVMIIAGELIGGLLLLSLKYHTNSSFVLIALLFSFGIASLFIIKKGRKVMCNCGGILGNNKVTIKLPIRNIILISLITYTIFFQSNFDILKIISDRNSLEIFLFTEMIVIIILIFYNLSNKLLEDLNTTKKRGIDSV